jgi:hypothetical protein
VQWRNDQTRIETRYVSPQKRLEPRFWSGSIKGMTAVECHYSKSRFSDTFALVVLVGSFATTWVAIIIVALSNS